MSIFYNPNAIIRRNASKKKLKKAVGKNLTLKKSALRFASEVATAVSIVDLTDVALNAIRDYKERIESIEDPLKRRAAKTALLANPKQFIQRVQNSVLFQVTKTIRDKYKGEKYRWLPSDADEPDPEHQLNYGKVFKVGVGEMPGERYGCKCGMEILVDEKELNLT